MNSYDLEGPRNPGMASIFDGPVNNPKPYLFKLSGVKGPGNKIMLAEEQASLRRGEASDPSASIINDGRWVAPGDVLSLRHSGKGDVTFADGHVQSVTPKFGLNQANSRPDI